MPARPWLITRRRFLHLLGASTVYACTQASPATTTGRDRATTSLAPTTTSAPTTLPPLTEGLPFSVWEELIPALRQSPDHLPARAAQLVDEGDPAAIFAFVRDEIRVLPPDSTGFRKAVTGRLWGARGTLRGGAGSPRDCADLLADLYLRAGYEAQVMEGDLVQPIEVLALSAPTPERFFQPAADEERFRRWYQALGLADREPSTDLDPNGDESWEIAANTLRPPPRRSRTRFPF